MSRISLRSKWARRLCKWANATGDLMRLSEKRRDQPSARHAYRGETFAQMQRRWRAEDNMRHAMKMLGKQDFNGTEEAT